MGNTVNRRPRLVNTPTRKQIQTQYFQQMEWKGICEDKNTYGVDQNTFAECENVYVDRDNVLSNRPGLSDVDLEIADLSDYKIYTTKSYIIYFTPTLTSKIIEIDKVNVAIPHTLGGTINETDLYFYEIGNILFAFGQNGLYKLDTETYELINVIELGDVSNIYVPFAADARNLFIYNNFRVDENIDYEHRNDVLLNPQNYNSSALQITANNDENIIDNVITNWPYNVVKLDKSILKNASRLETSYENPSYENLYYINGKIYTNGGFQKSIEVEKYDVGQELYVRLYLYDDNGELIKYNDTQNYTYQKIIHNDTAYSYVIVDDYWYKVDYTYSKENVLGVFISVLGRENAQSNNYRWYMNYVEINFNGGVDNIRDAIIPYYQGNSFYISAYALDKYIPFCFYYDTDENLNTIGVSCFDSQSLSFKVRYISFNFDNTALYLNWTSDLTIARADYIPYPTNETNINTLLSQVYFGRITENSTTHKLAYWTISNKFGTGLTGIDVSARDNVSAIDTDYTRYGLLGIDFKNSEQLNIFTKSVNSTDVYCTTISYTYNSENNSASIIKNENVQANMIYPQTVSAKVYLSYSLYFSNDEIDVPFGVLLLNDTEYLSDVYYDENSNDIILLSKTGKIFSNLSNKQSNISYKFSASPNLEYTGEKPSLIRPIGSNSFLYFVNDTSYVLQVRYNNENIQLYLPEGKENKYYDTVIDAEQTSDKSLVVIGNNVLYSVIATEQVDDKQLPVFQYIRSKLNLRVIEDSDSIIAYNSSTLLMPTYNGMAAVNYSQLISVEEQTVNYITDNIMTHWFKYVASEGAIKTCNHNYYLFVYHTGRKDFYMFDYRSNTWWYFTFDKNVKLMHTIGLYCFIVFEDNTLHYFDEKVLDAQWSITSQKLYLGNNTNYKQVLRFTIHTIGEQSKFNDPAQGDTDNIMDLRLYCYRKRMHTDLQRPDETYLFNVDFVRTYVIRTNYPKVCEFQYKLSSNEIKLKPLQLTGITIEYKVGGKVR